MDLGNFKERIGKVKPKKGIHGRDWELALDVIQWAAQKNYEAFKKESFGRWIATIKRKGYDEVARAFKITKEKKMPISYLVTILKNNK